MSARPGTAVAVRGLDGRDYVARYELGRGAWPLAGKLAWSIYRQGASGPVVRGATLASAVERLADFHRGETCGACGHVHSSRDAHYCHACGAHWTRGVGADDPELVRVIVPESTPREYPIPADPRKAAAR